MQQLKRKWLWIGVLILIVLSVVRLQDSWQWNVRALLFLKGIGNSIPIKASDCDHLALIWAQAGKLGDQSSQHHILEYALGCSQIYISIIRAVLPFDKDMSLLATQLYPNSSESWIWLGESTDLANNLSARRAFFQVFEFSRKNISFIRTVFLLDKDLALQATQLYPDSSESWFWLGESIAPIDHTGARTAYLRSVELSPQDGVIWCRLGWTYEYDSEFKKALDAYLKCCDYGDPGANGCYGAGRVMEQLDDPQKAIEYYRLSTWEGALKRADELENQVKP